MSQTVLVTGAAGFIGRPVCRALLSAGHRVVGLDQSLARDDVPGAQWFWADMFDSQPLISAAADCTTVIHLAAHANVRWCQNHPLAACHLNIGGCRRLVFALMRTGVSRIIYANSCAAKDPISVYGYTKRAGLLELREGAAEYDAEVISLRLANVYGYGEQDISRVVPALVSAAKNGTNPTISFEGRLERDFVHVADVAQAIVRAVECKYGMGDGIEIGIGTGRRTSLADLWQIISRECGRELPEFVAGPSTDYEPLSAGEDPGLASSILNWRPTITLEAGLKQLCQEHLLT